MNTSAEIINSSFHQFFGNSLAVMLLIDPGTHKIVDANPAAEKYYGWSYSQLTAMRIDQINTLSTAEINVEMEKARNQQRTYFKFRHRKADGSVSPVEVFTSMVEIDGKEYFHSIVRDISEQIEAEQTIAKNEKILKLFVENTPAAIAMFDNEMRYLVASRQFITDYGLSEQDIIGRSHYDLFPEIGEDWKALHQRGLAGETLKKQNEPFPRANGSLDWLHWEIHPWYEKEGQIGGIILFTDVVTKQVEAAEALKESEEKYRTFFEQSTIGLALTSMDGKLIEINPTFAEIVGRSVVECNQLTYGELTPKKYFKEEQAQLQSLRERGKYGPYEKEYIHRDGHLVPVRLHGLIIERNKEKFIWSSVEDISEKITAEKEIFEREKRLAQLAEYTNTITWEIDTNGVFNYVSSMSEKLTGYNAEELVGRKKFFDLLPSLNTSILKNEFANVLKRKKLIINSESIVKTKEGKEIWFAINAFPVYDEFNQLKGYRGSNIDINLRKQTEEALKNSHDLLKNLTQQVPGVVYQYKLNPDGSSAFIYSSQGMWDIYEVTPEEVKEDAKVVFTRIHPNDYDYIVNGINESAKNLTLYQSEFRVILPQQGLRWRQCNAKPLRLDDGSILWHGIITDITDKKTTEMQLLHFHDLMKYIIEHDRSAIAVHDRDLKYIYVSQRYLEQYNVTDTNIIGKHHYEVFPDLPQKWRDVHQKALKGEVSSADRDIYEKEDGTLVYTRWECRPWYEADSSIGGIVIYTEAINDRIERELEIKQLNDRLEILVQSVKELSSVQSVGWVQDIVVKSARKLISADGATVVFKENDQCFYAAEDAISPLWAGKRFSMNSCVSGWVMQHKQALIIEDIYTDSRVPIEAYGSTFVKSLTMVPINLSEPLGAIGNYWKNKYSPTEIEINLLQTLADSAARALENIRLVTELEQKVAELAKSELVKTKMVANIGDVIVIIDRHNINQYKSPNIETLFGWKPEELVGKNTWDIIHPDDMERGQQFLNKLAFEDGATGTIELRYKRKDGNYVWIEVTVANLLNDNVIHGYLGNYHDISGRKKNQQELIKAKERAEESDRLKSAFLANMSHEIRTPLNSIMGFASLMPDEEEKMLIDQYANIIVRNSEQLVHIIDDIVLYSRLQSKSLSLDNKAFNMCDLFHGLKQLFSLPEYQNGVELLINNKTECPNEITVDYEKIKQVFTSLISNAFKYTPSGTISFGAESKDKNQFVFYVNDTGIGILPNEMEKVFERFFRGSNTRKETVPGTGLGLSIAKEIIELLGGSIWVESVEGEGSTFYFAIPIG